MGSQAPTQKREREDDPPLAGDQSKRLRALAALKAKTTLQPAPAQEQHVQQPRGGQESSDPPGGENPGDVSTEPGGWNTTPPPNSEEVPQAEFGDYDEDAWAEDTDNRDAALFGKIDPDRGQDFDHQLAAEEQHWEEENFAQKLPPGWAKCPNAGTELAGLFTTKAPFGGIPGQRVPAAYQWKPADLVAHLRDVHGARVGTVIDLTMSRRYYKPAEFQSLGIQHVKIPCRGHGQVPEPKHVNFFVWEVRKAQKLAQDVWEKEKALLRKYDTDMKEYGAALREFQQAVALKALPADTRAPTEPLMKLAKQERALVEYRALVEKRPRVIAVHCTHGFNRSGYMIVQYLMRNNVTATVAQCIKAFTKAREPGIYKDEYIEGLFQYYRQKRVESGAGAVETPLVPAWKPGDESPENFLGDEGPDKDSDDEDGKEMKHDDAVGEEIHEEEANMYREHVVAQLRAEFLRRRGPDEDDGMTENDLGKLRAYTKRLEFPGSQPVSLSNSNQDLLHKHRYWSTWKADGTRYMAYLCHSGMFLIDRRMHITRVHMRFPVGPRRPPIGMLAARDPAAWVAAFKRGTLTVPARLDPAQLALHHMTLVEGEMVIDEQPGGGKERAFYVYDLMMIQGVLVTDLPWKQRYMLMEEVTRPRTEEADCIRRGGWPHLYSYAAEPFTVLRKEFWPLHDHAHRRQHFFPTIRHENDGLILQAYDAKYIPDTCNMLLKWKPASHNSVDFTLLPASHDVVQSTPECAAARAAGQDLFLGVWEGGRVVLAFDLDHSRVAALGPEDSLRKALTDKPARIVFNSGESPEQYYGMVVECNFVAEEHVWSFMRDRAKDKETPNALNTYMKVVKSIVSAIDDHDIEEQFKLAYMIGTEKYAKDIARQRAADKNRHGSRPRR
eukprot:jgi/Ulvmu1/5360/UM022_0154.1